MFFAMYDRFLKSIGETYILESWSRIQRAVDFDEMKIVGEQIPYSADPFFVVVNDKQGKMIFSGLASTPIIDEKTKKTSMALKDYTTLFNTEILVNWSKFKGKTVAKYLDFILSIWLEQTDVGFSGIEWDVSSLSSVLLDTEIPLGESIENISLYELVSDVFNYYDVCCTPKLDLFQKKLTFKFLKSSLTTVSVRLKDFGVTAIEKSFGEYNRATVYDNSHQKVEQWAINPDNKVIKLGLEGIKTIVYIGNEPETPVEPEEPDVPDEPDIPEEPDIPDVPDIPDIPDIPEEPEEPEEPGESDEIYPDPYPEVIPEQVGNVQTSSGMNIQFYDKLNPYEEYTEAGALRENTHYSNNRYYGETVYFLQSSVYGGAEGYPVDTEAIYVIPSWTTELGKYSFVVSTDYPHNIEFAGTKEDLQILIENADPEWLVCEGTENIFVNIRCTGGSKIEYLHVEAIAVTEAAVANIAPVLYSLRKSTSNKILELVLISGATLNNGDRLVYEDEEAIVLLTDDGKYYIQCAPYGWFYSKKDSNISGTYIDGVLLVGKDDSYLVYPAKNKNFIATENTDDAIYDAIYDAVMGLAGNRFQENIDLNAQQYKSVLDLTSIDFSYVISAYADDGYYRDLPVGEIETDSKGTHIVRLGHRIQELTQEL